MNVFLEPDCGGCKGQGAHSRRCRTNPDWMWQRLLDAAEELGDLIGSNDPEAANMAYAIAGRMRAKCQEKRAESAATAKRPQPTPSHRRSTKSG